MENLGLEQGLLDNSGKKTISYLEEPSAYGQTLCPTPRQPEVFESSSLQKSRVCVQCPPCKHIRAPSFRKIIARNICLELLNRIKMALPNPSARIFVTVPQYSSGYGVLQGSKRHSLEDLTYT